MLTITKAGLAAIRAADEGGFKLSMKSFKLSEHDISGVTATEFIDATDLFGIAVYSGDITLVEPTAISTVKLTLTIPKHVPTTGSYFFRELGIYLDTGELFAIGPLNPAYEKTSEFGIKLFVTSTANRLGDVAAVTINQNTSLPSYSQLRYVPAPIEAEHNVVAILDELTTKYGHPAAGLAVRSGPGMLHWSFVGHNRIYHGLTDSVADFSSFVVSPTTGGFWLNDGEVVICQITTGQGAGACRRMEYTKATGAFTVVDAPFEAINNTSTVAIWRDNANQLPNRTEASSNYLVLGHGINSWQRVDPTPSTYYTYEAFSVSSILTSESQFTDNHLVPPNGDMLVFVWCNGVLMPETAYSLSWNIITVYGKPYGTKIDILLIKKVASTISRASILAAFESKHTGDGQTKRFQFSVIPKSRSWVNVFINNKLVHQQDYDVEASSILLRTAAAVGDEIIITQLGLYEDEFGACHTYRTFRQITPGNMDVVLSDRLTTQSEIVVFVDGEKYSQDDFILLDHGIKLIKNPAFVGGSSFVDLTVFIPDVNYANQDAPVTVAGMDTGPQWIDPAGFEGPPNRLVPKTVSIISDGAQTIIPVPEVPNSDHVLLFIGGEYKNRSTYSYSLGRVIMNVPAQSGTLVDVVCFTNDESYGGFEVQCSTFNLITSGDTFYQLATVNDVDSIIVTLDGAYMHKSTYTVDPQSRIFFQAMAPGKSLEVWYFTSVPREGFRTTLRYDQSSGNSANNYPLSQSVVRKQDMINFIGVGKYDANRYDINASGDKVVLNPNAATNVPVVSYSFSSGFPKSRLLTREEYNKSVVSFNYRQGVVLLTREDVKAVLMREDVLSLFTAAELAVIQGGGGGTDPEEPPHAQPGDVFITTNWTVPEGVYRIRAVIIGAGGQGGGGSNDLSYAGHGGKRGEVLIQTFDVVPGQLLQIRLGVGGSSYLYTQSGTTVYPQPGDFGTSDGAVGYNGRDGGDTIFHQWVAQGGRGGVSEPAYAPTYRHADCDGEGQVDMATGSGSYSGGGAGGLPGVQTSGNNEMVFSYPGTDGAFGWKVSNTTGGGLAASKPGAGGGGASADPAGSGAFGGAGSNGVVYISWGNGI